MVSSFFVLHIGQQIEVMLNTTYAKGIAKTKMNTYSKLSAINSKAEVSKLLSNVATDPQML